MELADVIKTIVQNTLKSTAFCDVCYGRVVSIDPLKIEIDPAMQPLEEQSFILTEDVQERGIEVEDKLIMLRVGNGTKFLILSHVVGV